VIDWDIAVNGIMGLTIACCAPGVGDCAGLLAAPVAAIVEGVLRRQAPSSATAGNRLLLATVSYGPDRIRSSSAGRRLAGTSRRRLPSGAEGMSPAHLCCRACHTGQWQVSHRHRLFLVPPRFALPPWVLPTLPAHVTIMTRLGLMRTDHAVARSSDIGGSRCVWSSWEGTLCCLLEDGRE
jgi:hypothetical protein